MVFKLALGALLVWGSLAVAHVPDASSNERQEIEQKTIKSWVAHLNYFYPQFHVRVNADINSAGARGQLFLELDALEKYARGEIHLAHGALIHLACGAVCGDTGDGKCHTCSADGD